MIETVVHRSRAAAAAACAAFFFGSSAFGLTLDWVREFAPGRGEGLSADGLGNVYFTTYESPNTGGPGGQVHKLDSQGELVWSRPTGNRTDAVFADREGNYVTANIYGRMDLTKHDQEGDVLWAIEYDFGPQSSGGSQLRGISPDPVGNIVVVGSTGTIDAPTNTRGIFVSKLNPDGQEIWGLQYANSSPPDPPPPIAYSVTTDNQGNAYVSGTEYGDIGHLDAFLIKISSDGDVLWDRQFGTTAGDRPYVVAADRLGNFFVWSEFNRVTGFPDDPNPYRVMKKFDTGGNEIWSRLVEFDRTTTRFSNDIAPDGLGGVYLAGFNIKEGVIGEPSASGQDSFVMRYAADGTQVMTRQLGLPADNFVYTTENYRSIEADELGNVFLLGRRRTSPGSSSESDVFVAKLSNIPGDFNFDGAVDGNDFLAWQRGLGPAYDADDLNDWRQNFGAPAAPGTAGAAASNVAVPEPGAFMLALAGFGVGIGRRRRARGVASQSAACIGAILATVAVSSSARADLKDGLISYWRFDGDGADASGFDRDLTLEGGVGFAPGLFGQALDMHKNQSTYARRTVDDEVYDFGNGDFTVQIWANYYSTSTEQVLIEKFTGGSGPGWTFTKRAEQWVHVFGGGFHASPSQTISTGVWHQFIARRSGNQLQIRLDDRIVANSSISAISNSTTPLYIGRRNPADARNFSMNGRLDEPAIWNRALGDDEIAYLYNGGLGKPVIDALPGDFNFDGAVDGGDFLAWQRGLGAAYDADDLNDWRQNFGAPAAEAEAGALVAPHSAVPEPSALLLVAFALTGARRLPRRTDIPRASSPGRAHRNSPRRHNDATPVSS